MKTVVVTGASTGIGWGCVKVLVASGSRVFGSVRKQADGDRLSTEFGPAFTPLFFDVTDQAAVTAAARQVEAALGGETLSGLVNNAGIAVPGPLLHLEIDNFEHQLTVNITGQLIVTQAFAPLLGVDRSRTGAPGRIVMISSVGGKNAMPFLGAYSASKFALEGMAESLRRELMPFGIDVIIVAPGTVATPIWDKADSLDVTPFADTPYAAALGKLKALMVANGRKGLPVEKLGETVKAALTLPKPKTRYTVAPNPLQNLMATTLPKRIVDNIIARQLGLRAS
ncbi:MAG TPA: SDR family NAD(P)-dependent oxidoreductase [Reyranella sp.]|jgi:NAD(P)-dependent dehydrogenase (short-subunit alcohol dehydrogenase family)|nr:SDR family NAD(P)-dependent oxidoreductase [Reyranella sp.]